MYVGMYVGDISVCIHVCGELLCSNSAVCLCECGCMYVGVCVHLCMCVVYACVCGCILIKALPISG